MTCDNRVVNFIARHGVFYSRMLSVAGRNIQLCSDRFKLSVSKLIDLKCNLHVIVCMFGKLDCVTKMKLFKAYCCSFYGCELWDLWEQCV